MAQSRARKAKPKASPQAKDQKKDGCCCCSFCGISFCKNIGTTERTIRAIVAAVLVLVAFFSIGAGIVSTVLYVIAGVLALTALAGVCPAYAIFGLKTTGK
jgi:hypothetical protein